MYRTRIRHLPRRTSTRPWPRRRPTRRRKKYTSVSRAPPQARNWRVRDIRHYSVRMARSVRCLSRRELARAASRDITQHTHAHTADARTTTFTAPLAVRDWRR